MFAELDLWLIYLLFGNKMQNENFATIKKFYICNIFFVLRASYYHKWIEKIPSLYHKLKKEELEINIQIHYLSYSNSDLDW